jgi:ATP-dependent RNA helicase DeaD
MPKELLEHLKTVWVAGQQLRISHAGGIASVDEKFAGKKVPLSAPKKGGDRRVGEKKLGEKAPFKSKSDFVNRVTDVAKPKPKPKLHRKGTPPRG